jgi:hypothetical protein
MLGLWSAALLRKVRANAREFSVLCAAKARLRLKPDPANERPLADLTPAAEMRAAEMPTAMVAAASIMRSPMTTAVSTAMATTVTTATFRSGISCGRQRGRQHNDGDTDIES